MKILEGLKAHDRAMFGHLYDQYGAALFGVAKRIVLSHELAEEVLQDACLKIWNGIEQFNAEKSRLFTWMMQIIRNEAIERRRSRISKESQKTSSLDLHVYKLEEKDFMEMKIEDIGLRRILEDLQDDVRGIVNLIYFKGYTYQEVADETGMPSGAVKTNLHQAMIALRNLPTDH
ncbi:MAG: sigma-70 family RNA polymerase sigma factor [Saprospiraceae bacterium]|nr:sigma-70 family RNA polymerase sigma factor [Saprospiraceae bacterium]